MLLQRQQQQQQRQQDFQNFKAGLDTAVKKQDSELAANVLQKYPEISSQVYGSENYGDIAQSLTGQEQPGYTQAAQTAQNMAADRNYSDQEVDYWQDNYGHISDSPNALFNLDNVQQGAGNENGTGGGQQGNKSYLTEQGYDYRYMPEEKAEVWTNNPETSVIPDKENPNMYYVGKIGDLGSSMTNNYLYGSNDGKDPSFDKHDQILTYNGKSYYVNKKGYIFDQSGNMVTDEKNEPFFLTETEEWDGNTRKTQQFIKSKTGTRLREYLKNQNPGVERQLADHYSSLPDSTGQTNNQSSWFKPWTWGGGSANANQPNQNDRNWFVETGKNFLDNTVDRIFEGDPQQYKTDNPVESFFRVAGGLMANDTTADGRPTFTSPLDPNDSKPQNQPNRQISNDNIGGTVVNGLRSKNIGVETPQDAINYINQLTNEEYRKIFPNAPRNEIIREIIKLQRGGQ